MPAKASIQYAAAFAGIADAGEYWITRLRG
jgi:hypothetical protein